MFNQIKNWLRNRKIRALEVSIAGDKASLSYWDSLTNVNNGGIPRSVVEIVAGLKERIARKETRLGHLKASNSSVA